MNTEIAKRNLAEIGAILDTLGIEWFFMAGTLLGAMREADIIEHDEDTDLGLMPGTDTTHIHAALVEAGYNLPAVYGAPDDGYEMCFVKDGVKTDLFCFYETNGTFWHAADGPEKRRLYFHFTPFDLRECYQLGFKGYMPDPPYRYLAENYGCDWSVIKTKWQFWTDAPSMRTLKP